MSKFRGSISKNSPIALVNGSTTAQSLGARNIGNSPVGSVVQTRGAGPNAEPSPFPALARLDEFRPLEMKIITTGTCNGDRRNEFIARYLHLGHTKVGRCPDAPCSPRLERTPRGLVQVLHRWLAAQTARPLQRMEPGDAGAEPLALGRSIAVPLPFVDSHPEPAISRRRNHPQEVVLKLGRARQLHTRALRIFCPSSALRGKRLQGIRKGPRWKHKGTETLRQVRQTEKNPDLSARKRLEWDAQQVNVAHTRTITVNRLLGIFCRPSLLSRGQGNPGSRPPVQYTAGQSPTSSHAASEPCCRKTTRPVPVPVRGSPSTRLAARPCATSGQRLPRMLVLMPPAAGPRS